MLPFVFHRYLGDLSSPTQELMETVQSAPVHNIHAERTLGMADSQYSRAPNASTEFVGAKVDVGTIHKGFLN